LNLQKYFGLHMTGLKMMKKTIQLNRMILAALSFMLLLLAGCGGGGTNAAFTNIQVADKTFAYAQTSGTTGATGALTFNADGTWSSALGANVFSGTWTIDANGRLVCVTTAGGNHTVTYTLLDSTTSAMRVSAVELNPAAPNNPASYSATFTVAFTVEMIAGKKILYSSAGGSTGTIQFAHDGSWRTVTDTATYIGTWSIVGGKLVCVTTTGGNHTITYARLDATTDPISTSASEVDPANPSNPTISNVALTDLSGLATVSAPNSFSFNLTFKNLPASLPQTASTTPQYAVQPYRRLWALMVPTFQPWEGVDPSSLSSKWGVALYPNGIPAGTPAAGPANNPPLNYYRNPVAGITASFGYLYGKTYVAATLDNYFYFDVTYPTADGKTGEFTTPLMGFPIWSTPANSSWVYDYATNTMTQTQ
jgi:hypothetical protein